LKTALHTVRQGAGQVVLLAGEAEQLIDAWQ
jgi:hypothetical protein